MVRRKSNRIRVSKKKKIKTSRRKKSIRKSKKRITSLRAKNKHSLFKRRNSFGSVNFGNSDYYNYSKATSFGLSDYTHI